MSYQRERFSADDAPGKESNSIVRFNARRVSLLGDNVLRVILSEFGVKSGSPKRFIICGGRKGGNWVGSAKSISPCEVFTEGPFFRSFLVMMYCCTTLLTQI